MHTSNPTLATVAVALLSALPTVSAGIYTKSSPVLQVDAKSYDRLVAKSNYTTVRFTICLLTVISSVGGAMPFLLPNHLQLGTSSHKCTHHHLHHDSATNIQFSLNQ